MVLKPCKETWSKVISCKATHLQDNPELIMCVICNII